MRSILVALLILAPSLALAQADSTARSGAHRWESLGTLLTAGELSGSAAGRTITINNPKGGYSTAVLVVDRTRSAGTDLTMTCVSAIESGTPEAVMGTCTYDASGVCTFLTASGVPLSIAETQVMVR